MSHWVLKLAKGKVARVAVILDGQVQVYHRPHPKPDTDKGAIASIRKWLDELGYNPNTEDDEDKGNE